MKRAMIFFSSLSIGVSFADTMGIGHKPDTPKLPDVPYVVHDGTRPEPPVVSGATCVSIAPPSDAIVLFDGKNLDAWSEEGKPAPWEIKDGIMVAAKADITSKESFGAIQIHLEWRVPAGRKVDGQNGGNSGIFFMSQFEVQILQSHNNRTYPDGIATALYGQHPPMVNATAPQGEWQSYDITFTPPVSENGKVKTPAFVTIMHNGVITQNHQSYYGPSKYRTTEPYPENFPETGPLKLQYHGDPIEFRNIWLRPLIPAK